MNWDDVAPEYVAERQRLWERRAAIARARKEGATWTEIGRKLGITGQTAAYLARRQAWARISPIEQYFEGLSNDVARISKFRPPRPNSRRVKWTDDDWLERYV